MRLHLGIAGVDSHTNTVDQVLLLLEQGLIKLVWYAESGWNKGFRRAEVGVSVVRQHTCGRCVGKALLTASLHLQLQVSLILLLTDSTAVNQTSVAVEDAEHANLHKHIDTLQHDFADVFATPSGLPPDRGVEHVIPLLPNSQPPFQRMCRLSPSELQEVQRQITELLSKQLIEPSTSPYGAPVLFVEKKTGGWWLTTVP